MKRDYDFAKYEEEEEEWVEEDEEENYDLLKKAERGG